MSYFMETMDNLLHQTAFFNLTVGNFIMILVACVFLYLAIAKGFEPLLLVPIAFGMLLVNIYPDIFADPEQMKRVINNIISNSVKYMDKPKGKIDIRLLDEVDSVRIEIEDNGKGIAAKDLPLIFERFYRTDASRNSSQGGSGIGLSIVKKIIEDHGGYIWATSKEGEGTCMHFVIRKYQGHE